MEQSASRTASARHRTWGISTATENVSVYVRHRRLVTFVFERLINIPLLLLLLLLLLLTHEGNTGAERLWAYFIIKITVTIDFLN